MVHDPEEELVLHVGRGGVDLEPEHLVPGRVPPLICCVTANGSIRTGHNSQLTTSCI